MNTAGAAATRDPSEHRVLHAVVNLIITGIIGLIAIFLDVATSTLFINFGAFTAFTLVKASVVFHYVRQRRAGAAAEPGVLRGGPGDRCRHLRLSALPAGQLLALITRGFKASPPEMTATEKATVEATA